MLNHRQLGITEQEYGALFKVREMLKAEEILYDADGEGDIAANMFNMAFEVVVRDEYDCGTTCCIGGWMHLHMNGGLRYDENGRAIVEDAYAVRRYVNNGKSSALHPLFYPMQSASGMWEPGYAGYSVDYVPITAAHAVEAIENFLKTGDANWKGILLEAGIIEDKDEE